MSWQNKIALVVWIVAISWIPIMVLPYESEFEIGIIPILVIGVPASALVALVSLFFVGRKPGLLIALAYGVLLYLYTNIR